MRKLGLLAGVALITFGTVTPLTRRDGAVAAGAAAEAGMAAITAAEAGTVAIIAAAAGATAARSPRA